MSGAGLQGNEILIVEDDPDVLEVILMVLEGAGYRATGVRTADEGLERIQAMPETRVVVTDVNLRDRINGIEMAREMRRLGATASIVVMSADLHWSGTPLDPGMRFLAKPYDRKALLGAVEASMR